MLFNLFIVGAAKCGTSHLMWLFERTPGFRVSPCHEDHVFDGAGPEAYPIVGPDSAPILVTKCPTYLQIPSIAPKIQAYNPEVKIIICLRDHYDLICSNYDWRHRDATGGLDQFQHTVTEALEVYPSWRSGEAQDYEELHGPGGYVGRGLFAKGVQRYFDLFGRDRVFLWRLDGPDYEGMSRFLGVDVSPNIRIKRRSATGEQKSSREQRVRWLRSLPQLVTLVQQDISSLRRLDALP